MRTITITVNLQIDIPEQADVNNCVNATIEQINLIWQHSNIVASPQILPGYKIEEIRVMKL